jgi:hypothetical protein
MASLGRSGLEFNSNIPGLYLHAFTEVLCWSKEGRSSVFIPIFEKRKLRLLEMKPLFQEQKSHNLPVNFYALCLTWMLSIASKPFPWLLSIFHYH